ncbi:DUF3617 domain-containing protein [Thiomicrolovo sp. ZZH C-3]
MRSVLTALICSGFLFSACSSEPAGPDFKEGKWSITSKTEMQGMAMQIPATTFEQCLSAQDRVPMQKNDNDGCKVMDQKVDGDTVSWRYECQHSKGDGSITYTGESFQGKMNMHTDTGMGAMTMTTTMTGKYLGPCE